MPRKSAIVFEASSSQIFREGRFFHQKSGSYAAVRLPTVRTSSSGATRRIIRPARRVWNSPVTNSNFLMPRLRHADSSTMHSSTVESAWCSMSTNHSRGAPRFTAQLIASSPSTESNSLPELLTSMIGAHCSWASSTARPSRSPKESPASTAIASALKGRSWAMRE